ALIDAQRLRARDHLDTTPLRFGQLHAMGTLLGAVRAAEVAQARAEAAADIDRELLGRVAGGAAAFHEQAVVVVDLVRPQQMHVVLLHVFRGPLGEVSCGEPGHAPAADHTFGRDERRAGIYDRRAAISAT